MQPGDLEPVPFSFLTPATSHERAGFVRNHVDQRGNASDHRRTSWVSSAVYGVLAADLVAGSYAIAPSDRGQGRPPSPTRRRTRFSLSPRDLRTTPYIQMASPHRSRRRPRTCSCAQSAGLESVVVRRYGYAIEYDYVDPRELRPAPSSRSSACRAFISPDRSTGPRGIERKLARKDWSPASNAARAASGAEPAVFARDEAYTGVMIDDSRYIGACQNRIACSRAGPSSGWTLRADNADQRLDRSRRRAGLRRLRAGRRVRGEKAETRAEAQREPGRGPCR